MEHRQRKRLRVEELECRRLLDADVYGPVQLEIESVTQQSAVFVSASDGELAVTTLTETNIEGSVLLPTTTLGGFIGGQSHRTNFEIEIVSKTTQVVETKTSDGNILALKPGGPNGPGTVRPALGAGPFNPLGQAGIGNKPDQIGRPADTTPDRNESFPGGPGGDSSESSTAAEIAAAQDTLPEANGSEAGDGARRTEAQLRYMPAAPSSQNGALPDSADAVPLTSAAPYAARPDSLPQSENGVPPVPDAGEAESAANESLTEDIAPTMKLASAVWFALGQLPVAAALEPLQPEGRALVQDLLYADWDAVEEAIDQMLVELRTGIAWVTPQNVRDAVFASSAAVLAAFAGEAARRRQQRLKDEELLALAFDADGHLALA